MGSVKDINVVKEPTDGQLGKARFIFSNRYSVFDWGDMPDDIPGKGESLAMMSAYNFEELFENIPNHYVGLVENDRKKGFFDVEEPSRIMAVKLAKKPTVTFDPESNGHIYSGLNGSYLIPLEVVFRNSIPIGSSARDRYQPEDFGLDYDEWPKEKVELEEPFLEFSTKLEEQDRYISDEEAREISNLTGSEIRELKDKAREVNGLLNERANEVGFTHEDGKVEFVCSDGKIILADVAGTFDEDRFMYKREQISKEFLRQWYKDDDENWYNSVKNTKKEARRRGIEDWKKLCNASPIELLQDVLETAQNMYRVGTNRWVGEEIFEVEDDMDSVVEKIKKIKNKGGV